MVVSTKSRRQISFEDAKFIEDGELLQLLEDRDELSEKKREVATEYKTISDRAKAKILALNPEKPVRCGRWILQVKMGKAKKVAFTAPAKIRVSIKTVEEAQADGGENGSE
jgi:hypothetical protein